MKSTLITLCLLCVVSGCGRAYILEMEEVKRINKIPDEAMDKTIVTAVPEAKPGEVTQPSGASGMSVRASGLDYSNGRWLDSTHFRVPAKRPLGKLIVGSLALGMGIVFAALAGAAHADNSCQQIMTGGDFRGLNCLGRDLKTAAFGNFAGALGSIGLGFTLGAAASWTPEEVPQ